MVHQNAWGRSGKQSGSGPSLALMVATACAISWLASPALAGPPNAANAGSTSPQSQLPPSVQRDLAAKVVKEQPTPHQIHGVPPAQPTATVELKPGEEPRIEFDMPIFDFGRIKAGGDVAHDFWFTNLGTGPLEVTQVKPS